MESTRTPRRRPITDEERAYRKSEKRKKLKCYYCGQVIIGKAWRIDEHKSACTRCHNQE